MTPEACRRQLAVQAPDLEWRHEFLDAVPVGRILDRMLMNLTVAYSADGPSEELVSVLMLRSKMSVTPPWARQQIGNSLVGIGRFDLAAEVLQALLDDDVLSGPDRAAVSEKVRNGERD